MDWEDYEPQVANERELCGACRHGREHTVEEHLMRVRNASITRAFCDRARYTEARRSLAA